MQVLRYAARFAADWVCLEALTHCLYFNSIAKHRIGLRYTQYGLRYGTVEMGERSAAPALTCCMLHLGVLAYPTCVAGTGVHRTTASLACCRLLGQEALSGIYLV
jgi:hypothetical protein